MNEGGQTATGSQDGDCAVPEGIEGGRIHAMGQGKDSGKVVVVFVPAECSGELDRSYFLYLYQKRGGSCFSRASNMADRVVGVQGRPVSSEKN